MHPTYRAYESTHAAEEAIQRLLVAGVPATEIKLMMGEPISDTRDAPVGTLAGTTTPAAEIVGSYADVQHSGREATGAFAGDPDEQRRGSFRDLRFPDEGRDDRRGDPGRDLSADRRGRLVDRRAEPTRLRPAAATRGRRGQLRRRRRPRARGDGSVANVLAVFGVWALLSGAAQFVLALRRRGQLGKQWPMLLAGVGSVSFGIAYVIASAGTDPMLDMLAIYAAGGGIDFLVQAWLLARRRRRPVAVHA